jgi:lysozyme
VASDAGIVRRWKGRLAIRRQLRDRARASVVYWGRRAGSTRGRQMLKEARARWALRKQQVAEAERVIERHSGVDSMSDRGVALVASFEGFRSCPYQDAVGVWTIGYGETRGISRTTACISRSRALQKLRARLNRDYLSPVLRLAKAIDLDLTQNQADALGSLSYNTGPGVFERGRTMGDAMRSKNKRRIADAFLAYDKAGGRTLPGLTRRRRAERALFLR